MPKSGFFREILSLTLIICCFITISSAQEAEVGSIRGHVYDQADGVEVGFATVQIEGTSIGAITDENGFFNITDIPLGAQSIVVSFIGYEDVIVPIDVMKNKINYYKVELPRGGITLGVVDISAERQQAKTEVRISKLKVSKKQIKALPSTGGEADILQYLQVVPGIISTGDQGGQIFIRGGSPIQNKILLDGLTIYNPFHSIGLFSTFETEAIRNVDVLTGAFGAEHGGRISAVVDINTREGSTKRLGGQVSLSPFLGKVLVEGPLVKSEKGGNLTFMLTGKKSIIQDVSRSIYSYAVDIDSVGLPYDFTDTYGKLSYITPNGSKFNFFGFNFDDTFNDPAVAKIDWNNTGGGLFFDLLPNASALTLGGLVGFTRYDIGIIDTDNIPRQSSIREGNLALEFKYLTNESSVRYGIDVKSISTDFEFTNPFNQSITENQNTTEIAGFVTYRRAWERFVLEPGIRLPFYASLGEFFPEPRLGLKYNLTDDLRFKAGAGLYSQNLISTSNERDVVNLFTGFISGPDESFNDFNGNPVTSKLQKARHLLAGFEKDIGTGLQLNVEGFIKDFTQLVVINRNKTRQSQPDFATEIGEAYGVDFSAKYETSKFYLWATYSLAFVNRFDGDQEFPTVFDRRHNVNFLTTYTFGQDQDFLFSLRWNLGSGFPFTQTVAFYDNNTFQEGVSTQYETDNPENIGIIFSDVRNGGRLPFYHRLDVSLQKTFQFSESRNLELNASITNAYNRNNIFFFDRVEFEREDQLPIIPAISAKFNF